MGVIYSNGKTEDTVVTAVDYNDEYFGMRRDVRKNNKNDEIGSVDCFDWDRDKDVLVCVTNDSQGNEENIIYVGRKAVFKESMNICVNNVKSYIKKNIYGGSVKEGEGIKCISIFDTRCDDGYLFEAVCLKDGNYNNIGLYYSGSTDKEDEFDLALNSVFNSLNCDFINEGILFCPLSSEFFGDEDIKSSKGYIGYKPEWFTHLGEIFTDVKCCVFLG